MTTLIRESTPLFNRTKSRHYFRVGLCPTRLTYFAGDVDARQASDLIKMAEIAWTRVHAIINQARGDMHFK